MPLNNLLKIYYHFNILYYVIQDIIVIRLVKGVKKCYNAKKCVGEFGMKMYNNVLEKVHAYENKKNIVYATVESPSYRRIKFLYFLALIFTLGVNLILIYGHFVFETRNLDKNVLYTILTLSGLLIVSTIVLHFKKHLWTHYVAFVSNALSATGILVSLSNVMVDEIGDIKASFYYIHLAPLCILFVCTLALTIIAVRAHLKTRKTYNKILENLYSAYGKVEENRNITEEEWEEIIKDL